MGPATIFFSTFVSSFSVWNFSTSSIVVFFLLFFFAHISIIFIQEKFATTKKKCPNTARNAKGLPDLTIINSNFFFQLKKKKNFEIKRKLIQFRFEIVIISIEFHLSVT